MSKVNFFTSSESPVGDSDGERRMVMKKTGWKNWEPFAPHSRIGRDFDDKNMLKVTGDKSVLPTRWWNHLFYVLFGWKTVAVFEVVGPLPLNSGYHVGFRTYKGEMWVCRNHEIMEKQFAMQVGHEDCEFFALMKHSTSLLPIRLVERTVKKDPKYKDVSLY